MKRFKVILIILLAATIIVAGSYMGGRFFFKRFTVSLIESVEASTGLGIKAENISYVPLSGLRFGDIVFYKNNLYKEELFSASELYAKIHPAQLFAGKTSSHAFAISEFKIKGAPLNIENLNGVIHAGPDSIKAPRIDFTLNGEPYRLGFEITEPSGEFASEFSISSPKITIASAVKKENEIYKITKLEGRAFTFSFKLAGELSGAPEDAEGAALSLYGDANISGVELSNLRMDTRIKEEMVSVPLLNAHLYNGVLVSSAAMDLRDKRFPYQINCKLSDIDIREIIKNTKLAGKGIKGILFSEFSIQGEGVNPDSMKGPGRIIVKNANLGPMPLLTPLIGNIYGYLQYALPELSKVTITNGLADFYVGNRRLTTNNLTLWGEAISVYAKGYIDFDGNLDFEAENQFDLSGSSGEEDWQKTLREMMVQFGKMISKARLTGTLEKPKWKFEYLGGMENIFKGGLENILKGIFE